MSHTPSSSKQYYLITNVSSPSQDKNKEIDLHTQSWKLPYSIEDADLTFDGKPLNMLYEENRWQAEHSGSSRDAKKGGRGRRRESKK